MDKRGWADGATCLLNAYKYQSHDRDFVLFIMEKIGISRCPVIAQNVAIELQKMALSQTWDWIVQDFKDVVPKCMEIDEMVNEDSESARARKRQRLNGTES